jgi:hypothetical protein
LNRSIDDIGCTEHVAQASSLQHLYSVNCAFETASRPIYPERTAAFGYGLPAEYEVLLFCPKDAIGILT